jgi:hypothetical protein
VTSLRHRFQKSNIVPIPNDLRPPEALIFCVSVRVDRVSVGDQEKCGGKTMLVKDRDGLLELASQAVVESQGNECWFFHEVTIIRGANANCSS